MKINKKILLAGIIVIFASTFIGNIALASDSNLAVSAAASHPSVSAASGVSAVSSVGGNQGNQTHSNKDRINLVVVTSISGDTIYAKEALGQTNKTWTIITSSSTQYLSRIGAADSFSDIVVGDTITFNGSKGNGVQSTNGSSNESVMASRIRIWGDVNVQDKVVLHNATVTSVDDSADQLIVTTSDGRTVTVNATDYTKLRNGTSTPSIFSNIQAGMSIQIKGFWNSLKNTITTFKIRFK